MVDDGRSVSTVDDLFRNGRRIGLGVRPAPAKDFEADDPFEFVAVSYPVASGIEEDREADRCYIEEFALMGWPAARILALFESPLYAGPHAIRRRRALPFIEGLIDEVFQAGSEG